MNACIAVCVAGWSAFASTAAINDEPPVDVGSRLELFVDGFLVHELRGKAELRLHHPAPREVVLVTDRPWEGNTCGYFTVFRDGPIIRMYYRGSHFDAARKKASHPEYTCYAESREGIRWTRPELGLFEIDGSRKNNVIWTGSGTHNFTPFKDPSPRCPPQSRYKAVARGTDEHHQSLLAFQSPDGIHWSLIQEEPVITKGAFDSQNQAFWDPLREEYREYHRDFRDGKRDIRTATSKDFVHWSDPVWLEYPGAPPEHLYTNQIQPYYRAPHIFLGFPTRFLPERGSLTESLLMASRDGLAFRRWQEALIRPGLNPEKWQNRSNYVWLGLIESESSISGAPPEISLYANEGYYEGDSAAIRRYTIRLDGFVSVHAPMAGGEVITRPIVFDGKELVVNCSTSAAGSLRVEIQDVEGKPLPGLALEDSKEFFGDSVEQAVAWKNPEALEAIAGKPVRVRFVLKDADLYAFRFRS
ncbi:MAG: hypothetical protein JXA90_16025 [Planctomycetes bacterium]|nr:hypothetical protein [Planctomycetota bacterium]